MTPTGRQFRDSRFRAGLALGVVATRSGMDRDRSAYAEAMYGAPAWSEGEFARVHGVLKAAGVIFAADDGERSGVRPRKVERSS